MATVRNKSHRSLKISLSRGKTLRLNPGTDGQIAGPDTERESVKKLVEAGDLEILGNVDKQTGKSGSGPDPSRPNSRGHHAGSLFKKSGDR